jgi:outer membrane protein TolC
VAASVLLSCGTVFAQDAAALPQAPQPQPVVAPAPVVAIAGVQVATATSGPLRLSLDEAIQMGLTRSLSVAINRQNERQVSGLKLTALNALIPSLTAQAQTSTQQMNLAAMGFNPSTVAAFLPPGAPPINTIVKVDTTSAQLNLSQQIFNLPAFEIYRAAQSSASVATFNALLNRGDVVQGVATQYLRILADVDSIHNAQSQLQADTELVRQAGAQHDAGTGTNLDFLRARVEMQQRERELIVAENDFAKDKIQLNRLMGLPADQELELTDAIPYHNLEQLPLEEAKRIAYTRRKDLLSLQAQFRSSELQRRAIRYERLPAVTVGGYYGVLGETRGLYHGVFVAQAGLNFPIFQEARIRGDAQIADAQLSRLRSQTASLRQDIDQQIRSAMLDVNSSADLVHVARSNVDLAAEALGDARDRYRAGVDDNLPVLRAQATLADAQARLVSSMFQFNKAKLLLARSTGVVETQYQDYLGH